MRFHPFRALRPVREHAAEVAAVPYDVVTRDEAAALAEGRPRSFLHVGRSDIDFPPDTDPHDPRVYQAARDALERLVREGTLIRDPEPAVYVYRQVMDGRAQTGVVGCAHVEDYEHDVIRKHEKTRKDKEDDRTRHVLTLDANAEPVFLAYRRHQDTAALTERAMREPALYDFTAPDGVRHTVWRVADTTPWVELFAGVPVAYVADGHHRSASAWRAGLERRRGNPGHRGDEEYNWFLTVLFPSDELRILPYHRLVKDLNGLSREAVVERLRQIGPLAEGDPLPSRAGRIGIYLGGRWYRLELPPAPAGGDPVAALDASRLHEVVLAPVLGIGDPRTDQRLDFVGGIHGPVELARRVDAGAAAAAFSVHPPTMDQLLAVADAGGIMPPKSTWFEPKLRSGLLVHELR